MSRIGDNGGPPLNALTDKQFRALVRLIVLSRLPGHQKLLSLGVAVSADDSGDAILGAEDMKRICSVNKRDTVFSAKRDIAEDGLRIIATVSEPGKANRYRMMPLNVVASIIDAYNAKKEAEEKGQLPVPQNGTSTRPPKRDVTSSPSGTTPVPQNGTGIATEAATSPPKRDGSRVRAEGINIYTNHLDRLNKTTTVEQVDREINIRAVEFELKSEPTNPKAKGTAPRQTKTIPETEIAFESFWSLFPAERRRGKGKARELFCAIVAGRHKIGRATPDEMVQAVREGRGIDPSFPPMPETWLNQGRWMDDAKAPELVGPNGKQWGWWRGLEAKLKSLPADHWRKAIQETKPNGTWPWWIFGAPPGDPECLVPAEIVTEYGYAEIYKGKISHA